MRDDRLSGTDKDTPIGKPGTPVTLADEILAEDRDAYDEADEGLLAALQRRVMRDTVDHRDGPQDFLRQMPTTTRVGLAALLAMGCGALFVVVAGVRPDLDGAVAAWLGGVHVLVIVGALVGIALALRPTHRRPLGTLAWVGVAGLFALPFVLSAVPGLWPGMSGPVPNHVHLMCGGTGALVAIPAAALVLFLDRSGRPAAWRVLMAAAAAGLTAFAWGQWQCPSADPTHLLIAHSGSGLAAGLVVLAGTLALRMFRR